MNEGIDTGFSDWFNSFFSRSHHTSVVAVFRREALACEKEGSVIFEIWVSNF
jgi:hypothetical protein